MKVLLGAKYIYGKILGLQKLKNGISYRPFFYVKSLKIEDGLLLLNTVTYEVLFLSNEEADCFSNQEEIINDTVKTLVEKWFLVPTDTNDLDMLEQFHTIVQATSMIYTAPKISSFTILPTTDCDARCFYCFEHGITKRHMSEETAADVAKYILKNKTDEKILIYWHGGEPLYNSKAIDVICRILKENNVNFGSYIITNGYLCNEETIKKAISLWNLESIQITLDGTEEKYNRIKNFIYKNVNPYLQVMSNIEALLKYDVKVKIRMNMDQNNVEDIYNLTDELLDRFKEAKNIIIYPQLLFEESCAHIRMANDDIRRSLLEKQAELEEYILKNGKQKLEPKIFSQNIGHCMADTDNAILITPEGMLGKCQTMVNKNYIGSIYDDELDLKKINWYKQMRPISGNCDKCIYKPACVVPKCCIIARRNCSDFDRALISQRLERRMLKIYNTYKETE